MRWTAEQTDHVNALSVNLTPFAERARLATVAIAHISETVSEVIGSGVLLKIGDARFVLTCAHVVEADEFAGRTNIQMLGPHGTTYVIANVQTSDLPPDTVRERDPIDAAVLRLAPECLDPPGSAYLTLADLSVEIAPSQPVLCVGFPIRYSRPDHAARVFDAEPLYYNSTTVTDDRPITTPFVRGSNIAFDMDRKQTMFLEGKQRDLPKLNGTSGGGVWRYNPRDGAPLDERARLVGIFTEYWPGQHLGVATNVHVHLDLLCRAWPELRAVVALHADTLQRRHAIR